MAALLSLATGENLSNVWYAGNLLQEFSLRSVSSIFRRARCLASLGWLLRVLSTAEKKVRVFLTMWACTRGEIPAQARSLAVPACALVEINSWENQVMGSELLCLLGAHIECECRMKTFHLSLLFRQCTPLTVLLFRQYTPMAPSWEKVKQNNYSLWALVSSNLNWFLQRRRERSHLE